MEAAEAAIDAAADGQDRSACTPSPALWSMPSPTSKKPLCITCPKSSSAGTPSRSLSATSKVLEQLNMPADMMKHIEADIKAAENELDDDAE